MRWNGSQKVLRRWTKPPRFRQRLPQPLPQMAVMRAARRELEALRTALAEERLATAQLEERVRAIKQKQEIQAANLITEQAATREKLSQLDSELSRLRKANEQLQSSNAALRAANESGVGEPHLINKSMMAELESMRAARQVDIAEAEAIKGALVPLLVVHNADNDAASTEETS